MEKNKESFSYALENTVFNTSKFVYENDTVIKNLKPAAIKELNTDKIISIVESSLEFDGSFYSFCEDYGYTINNLEFFSTVPLSSEEYDAYVACGLFKIEKDDFKFIKYSDFSGSIDFDKILSVSFVPQEQYKNYLDFKLKYQEWQKNNGGVVVSVIGGEDYIVKCNKKVDDLFFGEYSKLKDETFTFIDNFLNNKKFYTENKIPWKASIYLEGPSCKTEFVDTIISNYDLAPISINKYNCDDSVLEILFSVASTIDKSIIIIEDIDELIGPELVTAKTLTRFLDGSMCDNGSILVMTSSKKIDKLHNISFRFDKFIDLSLPEYKESVNVMFGKFLNKENILKLRKQFSETGVSYTQMLTTRNLFIKTNPNDKKYSKNYKEIIGILEKITLETNKNYKTKKNIGLLT